MTERTPSTEAANPAAIAAIEMQLNAMTRQQMVDALLDAAGEIVEAKEALAAIESSLRARLAAEVRDHWPDIGVDQSDSTWLECSCGWDQSKEGAVDWVTHLEAAVLQVIEPE